jgi:hypothetical protein
MHGLHFSISRRAGCVNFAEYLPSKLHANRHTRPVPHSPRMLVLGVGVKATPRWAGCVDFTSRFLGGPGAWTLPNIGRVKCTRIGTPVPSPIRRGCWFSESACRLLPGLPDAQTSFLGGPGA